MPTKLLFLLNFSPLDARPVFTHAHTGVGVELDLAKALALYAQSAAQGWAGGQRDLGTMYAKGQVIHLGIERERES